VRILRLDHVDRELFARVEVLHDVAAHAKRFFFVTREMVHDARSPCVQVPTAEILGGDDLAGRGLHERRATEEDRAVAFDDDRLVAHRRHVGAARGARAEHNCDLRDALGGHARLVVEDAPEVIAVREDLVLQRQEGSARVDEVDAGQTVLEGDLLGADVLLDRHREVGAALHRRVVGDDHDLAAVHAADTGNDARRGGGVVVEAVRREWAQLEKGRSAVEDAVDALARQELAACVVLLDGAGRTALAHAFDLPAQVLGERLVVGGVLLELGARGADLARKSGAHRCSLLDSSGRNESGD
jgi:hypothetical protein